MSEPDPPPELTLIRVAEVVSRYLAEGDQHQAMGEIIAILEQGGVPWPTSEEDAAAIRKGRHKPLV
jgi:hypothetical protein